MFDADIQNEIAIHKPVSTSQAIGLAKLIESKIKDSKPKYQKPFSNTLNHSNTPTYLPTPTVKTSSTSQPMKLHIRRLSNAQLQERHAQGLCFTCDEKFIPSHKYTSGKFLLLMIDEEEPTTLELGDNGNDYSPTAEQDDTYF
ncbi:unnamed protein product [Vicia faba]|uniref:Uncharacterized protein n=1 Tax=Vicia faba TaxID=3906 RepID=A0AAV1APX6_VICFA|nr:unnamed protein product [Vicia faba]